MTDRKFTPPNKGEVREYVTRDGREARAYLWNKGLIGDIVGQQSLWFEDGSLQYMTQRDCDLFDKPVTREVTVWVVECEDGDMMYAHTRPNIKRGYMKSLTKHTITITEGQFDED